MTDPTTPAARPLPADVAGLVERILSMPHRMDCGLLGGYDGGCTCGHDQAVADAEAQARQIADLTARVEAERERAEDQAALVTCGCAYDNPTDLCLAHKRILDRLRAADIARAEKAKAEVARLTAELDEFQALFDLIWKADMRATQMWQDANPGNDLVWPDGANLTLWLMGQVDKAEAENARLREALIWCSGSDDFQEGGKARKGWIKLCAPLIHMKGGDNG